MTISYVGAQKGDFNGTPAISVTTEADISTQAGDVALCFIKHESGSTTRTMSDSAGGNTWTSRGSVNHTNTALCTEVFTSVLTTGSTTHRFTCTFGANRDYAFIGVVVYRTTTSWTYFDHISAQGSSTTPSAGSLTPTGAYVAMAGFGEFAATSWTQGTSWTGTLTGTFAVSFVERRTNTTGESITGNATSSASMDWTAQMVVFLESAGPPPAPPAALSKNRTFRPRPYGPGIASLRRN